MFNERTIYKTVNSGGSFGANPLRQEIGLGRAKSVKQVEIFWPSSGLTQKFDQLALDSCYTLREGDSHPALVKLESFRFSNARQAHHHHQP